MKHFLLVVLTIFFINFSQAQDQTQVILAPVYEYSEVDIKPDFPGGMNAFYKFVGKNFEIPDGDGIGGKIIISFVIESDGSLTNFKSVKDVGRGSGRAMIEVIKKAGNWIPGEKDGLVVGVSYQLPITIKANN